jgi:hypothetical protein
VETDPVRPVICLLTLAKREQLELDIADPGDAVKERFWNLHRQMTERGGPHYTDRQETANRFLYWLVEEMWEHDARLAEEMRKQDE